MKLFLFVVSSSTSYRFQRLVAQHGVDHCHRGWPFDGSLPGRDGG
jgi:hypothetical protein